MQNKLREITSSKTARKRAVLFFKIMYQQKKTAHCCAVIMYHEQASKKFGGLFIIVIMVKCIPTEFVSSGLNKRLVAERLSSILKQNQDYEK